MSDLPNQEQVEPTLEETAAETPKLDGLSRPAWRCPRITHIDLGRTLGSIGSGADNTSLTTSC